MTKEKLTVLIYHSLGWLILSATFLSFYKQYLIRKANYNEQVEINPQSKKEANPMAGAGRCPACIILMCTARFIQVYSWIEYGIVLKRTPDQLTVALTLGCDEKKKNKANKVPFKQKCGF